MERVISYVDSFNLYFGINQEDEYQNRPLRKFLWINVRELSEKLLKPNQKLIRTKLFTARVSNPQDKRKRQQAILDATATLAGVNTYLGEYQDHIIECHKCGNSWHGAKEKGSDVNLAVHAMSDAFQDNYDVALIISADGDLHGACAAIMNRPLKKKVVVAFPPNRYAKKLKNLLGRRCVQIDEELLKQCQFPQVIKRRFKKEIAKPKEWN